MVAGEVCEDGPWGARAGQSARVGLVHGAEVQPVFADDKGAGSGIEVDGGMEEGVVHIDDLCVGGLGVEFEEGFEGVLDCDGEGGRGGDDGVGFVEELFGPGADYGVTAED